MALPFKLKKSPRWPKIFLGAILILSFILLAGWGYVNHLLNQISRPEASTVAAENFVEETDALAEDPEVETLSPDEIQLRLADQVLMDKDVLNLLLIGQDTQEFVSGTRSDSIILVTINQKNKSITATSFMRDLYVDIPEYKKSRLNTAYTLGGAELLDETIERNFGIHIDGNIAVDFTGFAKCIDIIGGVDMELTASEAGAINKELYKYQPSFMDGTDPQADRWALVGGMQHLTGEEALQYARIREIDNDFSRTSRQRKLLSVLFEKLKNTDLKTFHNLLEEALPLLTTDLANTKLIGYGAGILLMQPATFQTDRIPINGAFKEAVVHKMQVLIPDLEKNQQHLKELLYGGDSTSYVPTSSEAPAESTQKQKRSPAQTPAQAPAQAPAPILPLPATDPYETAPVLESVPPDTSKEQPSYEYGPGMPSPVDDTSETPQTEPLLPPSETADAVLPEPVIPAFP